MRHPLGAIVTALFTTSALTLPRTPTSVNDYAPFPLSSTSRPTLPSTNLMGLLQALPPPPILITPRWMSRVADIYEAAADENAGVCVAYEEFVRSIDDLDAVEEALHATQTRVFDTLTDWAQAHPNRVVHYAVSSPEKPIEVIVFLDAETHLPPELAAQYVSLVGQSQDASLAVADAHRSLEQCTREYVQQAVSPILTLRFQDALYTYRSVVEMQLQRRVQRHPSFMYLKGALALLLPQEDASEMLAFRSSLD